MINYTPSQQVTQRKIGVQDILSLLFVLIWTVVSTNILLPSCYKTSQVFRNKVLFSIELQSYRLKGKYKTRAKRTNYEYSRG